MQRSTLAVLLAYCGALFIAAIIPGPGVTAIVARALGSGFRPTFFMGLGLILGDMVYLTAVILGLEPMQKLGLQARNEAFEKVCPRPSLQGRKLAPLAVDDGQRLGVRHERPDGYAGRSLMHAEQGKRIAVTGLQ